MTHVEFIEELVKRDASAVVQDVAEFFPQYFEKLEAAVRSQSVKSEAAALFRADRG